MNLKMRRLVDRRRHARVVVSAIVSSPSHIVLAMLDEAMHLCVWAIAARCFAAMCC
jgi:hypothetical protein